MEKALINESNESRKNTMNWIRNHMDKLKNNDENDCADDIVNELSQDEDAICGTIGISKEMIEGRLYKMNKEELIKNLKYTEEKHKNDTVDTFGTNISKMCSDVLDVLSNCIEIPEDATNGDIVMAVFPDAVKSDCIESGIDKKYYLTITIGDYEIKVSRDWWLRPYKRR